MGFAAELCAATFGACVGCFVGGALLGVIFAFIGLCLGANSRNSNNDSYWFARGFFGRPADVGAAHALWSNAHNPNNSLFGAFAVHPSAYVAGKYGRWVALISRVSGAAPSLPNQQGPLLRRGCMCRGIRWHPVRPAITHRVIGQLARSAVTP